MALPRHLTNKLEAYSREVQTTMLLDAICAGADYGSRVFEVLNRTKNCSAELPPWWHVIQCFIRARWAYLGFRQFRKTCPDNMDRVPTKLYVGLEQVSCGKYLSEWRAVTVPLYFLKKLEELNSAREAKDRREANLVAQIAVLRNKIYLSRGFPPRLRLIILERDNYRCQICLRGREMLLRLGRHLEVDHILAFVDGGKTTYSNGMTICSECNIAKHHAKRYMEATRTLERN
jgi:5-methylcytosine-specific restriction endonuclease McrA